MVITDQSQVEDDLTSHGVLTEEIDIVIMTHMHFDHACGLTKWQGEELVSISQMLKFMFQK